MTLPLETNIGYIRYYFSFPVCGRFYDRCYFRGYNNGKWIRTRVHVPLKAFLKDKQRKKSKINT